MKRIGLITLFFFFFSFITLSQNNLADTTNYKFKRVLGGHVLIGLSQQNFDALHNSSYGYLLNKPSNYLFHFEAGVQIGNPEKVFLDLSIGTDISSKATGTYNNYKIVATDNRTWYSASVSFCAYKNHNNKILKAIYPSAGVAFPIEYIASQANGRGIINADTSFYYELSKVKSTLLRVGCSIEFFSLTKNLQAIKYPMPFTVSLGYNIQLDKPIWAYSPAPTKSYVTNNSNQRPAVNLGGFYFTLGYNIWFTKASKKN